MTLISGHRIGPYEVTGSIGAGGMGEVYRAHDTRLNRDVALKVLPEGVAGDPDRLARFRREAQVLASLNHQNIAAIHGLEEDPRDRGSSTALVLELVEGPTLADRIALGALPIDEALRIAAQVAHALEAAHERGVVHRDLKPANIKIRGDGTVKVLDFGLAKALEGDASSQPGSPTLSPTLTSPAMMTGIGVILGTAAYMAPEQARGKAVDKRADIWAFGVVLFEMLAGRRLFPGSEVSDTLAFVLTKEPDWAALPSSTPASLRRLLRRCLDKDRTRRLADIADAQFDIEDALQDLSTGSSASLVAPPGRDEPRWRRVVPWAVAGTALAALVATLVLWAPWRNTPSPAPVRVLAQLGTNAVLSAATPSLAMSPDGTTLAFVARPLNILSTRTLLFARRLDRLDAQVLDGTEGGGRAVLLAGRRVDRVFRRRIAQEDSSHRWCHRHAVRRVFARAAGRGAPTTRSCSPRPKASHAYRRRAGRSIGSPSCRKAGPFRRRRKFCRAAGPCCIWKPCRPWIRATAPRWSSSRCHRAIPKSSCAAGA